MCSAPYLCPRLGLASPSCRAQRRLPSMISPTCLGSVTPDSSLRSLRATVQAAADELQEKGLHAASRRTYRAVGQTVARLQRCPEGGSATGTWSSLSAAAR
jgi:hypothetical protein